MDYLSLCLICKDENEYLPEWLDYHILMGVDRFYIFDNDSQLPLRDSLKEYIDRGWVIVVDFPGKGVQLHAYDTCLQVFGKNSRWIGFIDTDEFLVPRDTLDLKKLLMEYENFGGLAVSSLFFGSNGQKVQPSGGQITGYTMRTAQTYTVNRLIKSIVQPDRVHLPCSPHDFLYKDEFWCVNEQFHRVDFQQFPNSIERIQLNHYFCRSYHEIDQKLKRRRGDTGENWPRLRFDLVNQFSDTQDAIIFERLQSRFEQEDIRVTRQEGALVLANLQQEMRTVVRQLKPKSSSDTYFKVGDMRAELATWLDVNDRITIAEDHQDFEEIKRLSLERLRIYPQRILAYIDFSFGCLRLGDTETAWQALAEAWKRAPNSYHVMKWMGFYFLRVQNYDLAEKISAMMLAIAPHDLTALGYSAEALIGHGRFEEALKIGIPVVQLSSLTGEFPEDSHENLIRGMAGYLEKKKDYRTLVALWEAGLKGQPTNLEVMGELIKVHIKSRNKFAARQWLQKLNQMAPGHALGTQLGQEMRDKGL